MNGFKTLALSFFFLYFFHMKYPKICGRLPESGSCPGSILIILLAALFLSAGCASRQSASSPAVTVAERPTVEKKLDVIDAARSNLGVRYRYGGNSPQTGFDCSGLVCWSYEQVGISLPRRARDQLMFGVKVEKNELQPGDIVVFKGTYGRSGWHSGIYTGDGKFIHSPSSGKGVTESALSEAYFARRYAGASRIPRDGSAASLYAEYQKREAANAKAAKSGKSKSKGTVVASAKSGQGKKSAKAKPDAVNSVKAKQNAVAAKPGKKSSGSATVASAKAGQSNKKNSKVSHGKSEKKGSNS